LGFQESDKEADAGGFPCSVSPEQTVDAPRRDLQADIVEDLVPASEAVAHIADIDDRIHGVEYLVSRKVVCLIQIYASN
jgi:hypothetical protein